MTRLRSLLPPTYTPDVERPPRSGSSATLLRLAALLTAVAGVAAFATRAAGFAGAHVVTADSGFAHVNARIDTEAARLTRVEQREAGRDRKLDLLLYMTCTTTRRVDPAAALPDCGTITTTSPGETP